MLSGYIARARASANYIVKWGLLEELADRFTFAVSVFHAYGHQWACQLV